MHHHQFLLASSTPLLLLLAVAALLGQHSADIMMCAAFQIGSGRSPRPSTRLFLEDHIANMIDNEMRRLYQKHVTESEWNAKQAAWAAETNTLPENYDFTAEFEAMSPSDVVPGFSSGVDRSRDTTSPRRRKDEKMASNDPMRYCADRCVTTGNCDVFEDMFDLGPEEVIKFCKDCVLSEEEEPCDVPVNWFEDDDIGSGSGGEFGGGGLHP